ncbi:MAG: TauD/TfdA family dioxygenase, partial [Alphaproteobacteria bacterium]
MNDMALNSVQTGLQVDHPSAWRVATVSKQDDWIHALSDPEIQDLAEAVKAVTSRGLKIVNVGRKDFELPVLGPVLARIREDLVNGRGVALLRGVPVDRLSREDAAMTYWGIGLHIGEAVSQNAMGHVLGHVKDVGDAADDVNTRGYRSRADLPFHNDIGAEVIGLMCLQKSKSGGMS